MKTIGSYLLSFAQCIAVIALYWLIGLVLAIVSPHFIPGYTVASADNDTRTFLILFLFWDRFYGPYSVHLKAVAKALTKKKRSAN